MVRHLPAVSDPNFILTAFRLDNVMSIFTLFASLPSELQRLIWEDAVAGEDARVVEIRQEIEVPLRDGNWHCQYTSRSRIPGLLHATRESRYLALRRWRLCFPFKNKPYKEHPSKIFFDAAVDILYFGEKFPYFHDLTVYSDNVEDRGAVRKIAFDLAAQQHNEPRVYRSHHPTMERLYNAFPNLAKAVIIERFHPKFGDDPTLQNTSLLMDMRLRNDILSCGVESIVGSTRKRFTHRLQQHYICLDLKHPEVAFVTDQRRISGSRASLFV